MQLWCCTSDVEPEHSTWQESTVTALLFDTRRPLAVALDVDWPSCMPTMAGTEKQIDEGIVARGMLLRLLPPLEGDELDAPLLLVEGEE